MPRLDGVEMLKSMKKAGRKEKVIIMTANPSDPRLLDEDMPRVFTQLQKPFRIDNFLDIVIAAITGIASTPKIQTRQTAMGGRS